MFFKKSKKRTAPTFLDPCPPSGLDIPMPQVHPPATDTQAGMTQEVANELMALRDLVKAQSARIDVQANTVHALERGSVEHDRRLDALANGQEPNWANIRKLEKHSSEHMSDILKLEGRTKLLAAKQGGTQEAQVEPKPQERGELGIADAIECLKGLRFEVEEVQRRIWKEGNTEAWKAYDYCEILVTDLISTLTGEGASDE